MRKSRASVALALVFALGLAASEASAQKRGPSTPEERAQVVRLVRALESDPLGKEAKDARSSVLRWLIEVPDVSVTVCSDYLKPLMDKDKNYSSELFFQMTLSSAAFIIEHPDQAKDDVAVNKAGVEGALRAYEAILKQKPKAQWPFLDELIQRREKGTLEEYVRGIAATKCKGEKD